MHINGKLRRVLDAYFKTGKLDYDFPIELRGSEFQKAVWEKTKTVVPGATMSYSQLAALCGCPKASRAVAGALHRNPVCIFIPCHRIIGANGSLTGYAGGLDKKSFLLELEGATKNLLHCSY